MQVNLRIDCNSKKCPKISDPKLMLPTKQLNSTQRALFGPQIRLLIATTQVTDRFEWADVWAEKSKQTRAQRLHRYHFNRYVVSYYLRKRR